MTGGLLSASVLFTSSKPEYDLGESAPRSDMEPRSSEVCIRRPPKVPMPLTTLTGACERYWVDMSKSFREIPELFRRIDRTREEVDVIFNDAKRFLESISDQKIRWNADQVIFYGKEIEVEDDLIARVIDYQVRYGRAQRELKIHGRAMSEKEREYFTSVPFIEMVKGRVLNWAAYSNQWAETLGWTSRFIHVINPDEKPLRLSRLHFETFEFKLNFIVAEVCKKIGVEYSSERGKIKDIILRHSFARDDAMRSLDPLKELTITVVDNYLYISIVNEIQLRPYYPSSAERGAYSGPIDLL